MLKAKTSPQQSLKIAEAFERNHKDVLRAIEKIITQVSDSFGKRNFTPTEYEQENNLGLMVKYPKYELTKDGFMIVVMSFTGEKAMAIKEWYINAFNAMQAKLFPSSQYGLKALPEPPTATKAQLGILFNRVKTISGGSGKIRAELWSRFQNHFKLSSYKDLPADKFDEAMEYLDLKEQEYSQSVEMLWISRTELNDLVTQQLKSLPVPAPLEGDVMPKSSKNTLSVDLNMMDGLRKITFDFKTNAYQNGRWAMWQSDGNFSIRVMDDDEFLISSQQLPKYIADSMGGMIKRDHLLSIIEAAAVRLKN